jgi:hypothetical protein
MGRTEGNGMKEYICIESPNEVEGGMLVREQELIRCKDCKDYKAFKNGGFHHYCETIGCVVYDDDFCCWAERKNQRIKDSKEIYEEEDESSD